MFFVILISFASCVPSKKYVYFNDLKENPAYPGVVVADSVVKFSDPHIEIGDILSITTEVFDPLAESEKASKTVGGQASNSSPNYPVDKNGYVELRMIGFVKLVGLTTSEARELIKQKAKEFYKDPVVNVHIENFQVTVLGEVGRVGVVKIESEKTNILDVLAQSGDLRTTAKRHNILIARSINDKVVFARLDISSSDIYKSPYFYVKQHDLIYVEATNFARQSTNNSFTRALSYISGTMSVFSFLLLTKIIK
jgi:polysaccharide export outer membrane protein